MQKIGTETGDLMIIKQLILSVFRDRHLGHFIPSETI